MSPNHVARQRGMVVDLAQKLRKDPITVAEALSDLELRLTLDPDGGLVQAAFFKPWFEVHVTSSDRHLDAETEVLTTLPEAIAPLFASDSVTTVTIDGTAGTTVYVRRKHS